MSLENTSFDEHKYQTEGNIRLLESKFNMCQTFANRQHVVIGKGGPCYVPSGVKFQDENSFSINHILKPNWLKLTSNN